VRATTVALLVVLALPDVAVADDEVPSRNRALVLLRVLAYDRNLAARATDAVVVSIVFLPGDRASEKEAAEMAETLEGVAQEFRVTGRRPRALLVPWRGEDDLDKRLRIDHPVALYVCGALEDETASVTRVTRLRQVLSFGPRRRQARDGLAVAIAGGAARAVLVINPRAAKAEGSDLASPLLALAEVVGMDE